jgi:hypothetical protein
VEKEKMMIAANNAERRLTMLWRLYKKGQNAVVFCVSCVHGSWQKDFGRLLNDAETDLGYRLIVCRLSK